MSLREPTDLLLWVNTNLVNLPSFPFYGPFRGTKGLKQFKYKARRDFSTISLGLPPQGPTAKRGEFLVNRKHNSEGKKPFLQF